jgi:hypothetical protein
MEEKELIPGSHYEERRVTPRWRHALPPRAGIWLLDGGWHCATVGTEAEARLREQGALQVAGLVFEGARGDTRVSTPLTLIPFAGPQRSSMEQTTFVRRS